MSLECGAAGAAMDEYVDDSTTCKPVDSINLGVGTPAHSDSAVRPTTQTLARDEPCCFQALDCDLKPLARELFTCSDHARFGGVPSLVHKNAKYTICAEMRAACHARYPNSTWVC